MQCPDSRELALDEARYIRNVKRDPATADEMEESFARIARQEPEDQTNNEGRSSRGPSSTTMSAKESQMEANRRLKHALMSKSLAMRVSKLKNQLRFVILPHFLIFTCFSSAGYCCACFRLRRCIHRILHLQQSLNG